MCPECTPNFVRTTLEDASSNVPPKCPICRVEIVGLSFERQLDAEQANLYLSIVTMKVVEEGCRLMYCPSCSYFEVWPDGFVGMDFFFCKKETCSKQSCAHCKAECRSDDIELSEEDFEKASQNSSHFIYHMECAELAPHKSMFENAIKKGAGMSCPSCGHFGRKDSACTHIRCIQCREVYCYVCGLLEKDVDKAPADNNIYSHNIDWDINPLRCPMHLTEIEQIDSRWSTDDDECVAFFSRIQTLKLLREVFTNLGSEMFQRLQRKYESVLNCGFTMEEILDSDLTLIRREVEAS